MLEEYPAWGGAFWSLPSGRLEEKETPREGACRELAEETGLVVPAGDLVLLGTCSVTTGDQISQAWNFIVDVDEPTLAVRDPDGLIQEARWFELEDTVSLLRRLPYPPLSEPAVAALTNRVSGRAHWAFTDPREPPLVTLADSRGADLGPVWPMCGKTWQE